MVTRLGRAVSDLATRPLLFVTESVGPDSFALNSSPCPPSKLISALHASVGQRFGSQGKNLCCHDGTLKSPAGLAADRITMILLVAHGGGGNRFPKRTYPGSVVASAWRWNDEEIAEDALGVSFQESVNLFNAGEYYQCHDVLESLWNDAREPQRSILHGILQCAVGLYHLLHQNHRGAMVELGEGLTKLRRVGLSSGPLHDFEQQTSAVLEFIYNTQLEHAACSDDICITMDGSEQSYRLLGNFGAGQVLYKLAEEADGVHIHFVSQRPVAVSEEFAPLSPARVKVPLLQAKEDDLYTLT